MEDIYKTACKIRSAVENNKPINTEEFKQFESSYPKLFSMLKNPNMDRQMFDKLFQTLKTNPSESGASTFSEFGAEKYLYPQFGKPSKQDLSFAKQKVREKLK